MKAIHLIYTVMAFASMAWLVFGGGWLWFAVVGIIIMGGHWLIGAIEDKMQERS